MTPRVLVADIENSPAIGYFWGSTYQTNIIKVIEPSRMMSIALKWYGEKKISFFSDHHTGHDEMIARTWDALNEADAVVTYNGARHDSPHIQTEFLRAGASPQSPYREIDLYRVVRSKLKFQSNRLDYVSQELEIGKKVEHEGFPLWLACMAGDEKAWGRMRAYNLEDVRLTEQLYDRLRPLVPQSMHPNYALDGEGCPKCGSTDVARRGFAMTTTARYQRFVCRSCGQWSRGKQAVETADLRSVA